MSETTGQHTVPTREEQMAEYRRRKAAYDEAKAAWMAGGCVGDPPPHPVRPHTPGTSYGGSAPP